MSHCHLPDPQNRLHLLFHELLRIHTLRPGLRPQVSVKESLVDQTVGVGLSPEQLWMPALFFQLSEEHFFTGQSRVQKCHPDPARSHRTEVSPADQELDTKLSQFILVGSRSNQTDGKVLVGISVTKKPPQTTEAGEKEAVVGVLTKFHMKPLLRNFQVPYLQDGIETQSPLFLLRPQAKQAPGSTPLNLLPCHPDYHLLSWFTILKMPLALMLRSV